MKKLLLYIAIVLGGLLVIDVSLGLGMKRYVKNAEIPGDYRSLDYLLKSFDEDVLVLGSSVALNSLDPSIIADSLGVSAYNGASNGQTLTYQLVALKSILDGEHKPSTVILGIKPHDLTTEGSGNRINFLSPYYGLGYGAIDSVLNAQTAVSPLLMKSSLYRFNTIWFRILLYNFFEPGVKGRNGFIAKDIPSLYPQLVEDAGLLDDFSEQRSREFKEIVEICKANGINLIVYFPPFYYTPYAGFHDSELYRRALAHLRANGMRLYDDMSHPEFLSDSTLFYDNVHLNYKGAERYTKLFVERLQNDSIF